MAKRKNPEVAEMVDAVAASQARVVEYRLALKNLVEACRYVNIGALNGRTVKDMRNVMTFLSACDAAVEVLGED